MFCDPCEKPLRDTNDYEIKLIESCTDGETRLYIFCTECSEEGEDECSGTD